MKRRWWLGIGLLPVVPWLLVRSCEKPEATSASGSPEPVRKNPGASEVLAPAAGESSEAAVNERTRPSHRPEPKVYAKPPPQEYPPAVAVEGKPGFVTSPYSGKIIDVNDIPPGTLVADPTYPVEEKKYFRTP